MVFSSYVFIFAFLPVVLLGYYLLSHIKNSIYQRLFLIGASLFFYGFYNVKYLLLIIASMAVNYLIALFIQKWNKQRRALSKAMLAAGVLFNTALIGYFKYYDFFVSTINSVFKTDFNLRHILLPLGISFFTFQQLSFLVSVFKGEEKVEKLRDYVVFVTFFPQLVAGPIVLYSEVINQFKDEKRRFFNEENFAAGLFMFVLGLFKKAVIADTVAVFADNVFSSTGIGLAAAWAGSLSYTMQIFFDFSGYSDMAIGLGKMFNIELPFNFISPYKSKSISEFWRRWHITLGRALSTYIYIPLGGNRKGLGRTCVNLMLTFFVSGLWHGAAWTFVLWGVLHGAFTVFERLNKSWLEKIPAPLRVAATFLIVNALWVLFRADSFSAALEVYKGMICLEGIKLYQLNTVVYDGMINFPSMLNYSYCIGVLCVLLICVFAAKSSADIIKGFKPGKKNMIAAALAFGVSMLMLSRESVFIYFNF